MDAKTLYERIVSDIQEKRQITPESRQELNHFLSEEGFEDCFALARQLLLSDNNLVTLETLASPHVVGWAREHPQKLEDQETINTHPMCVAGEERRQEIFGDECNSIDDRTRP